MKKKMIGLCAAAVVSVIALMPNFAFASNHYDTNWLYSFAAPAPAYATEYGREKLDDSSTYIQCTDITKLTSNGYGSSFTVVVHGSNNVSTKSGTYKNLVYNGKKSPQYTIIKGTSKYMINYVYEKEAVYAAIYCTPDSGSGGYIQYSGVWSPDSIE